MASTSTVDQVISLSKRRGFVYQCGEIYGGTRSAWDYGPLGVELKDNIKRQWWKAMVQRREDIVMQNWALRHGAVEETPAPLVIDDLEDDVVATRLQNHLRSILVRLRTAVGPHHV